MKEQRVFTIEQFYTNILHRKLLGGKCKNCGKIHLPPRPLCERCFSKEFEWEQIPTKGHLLTYTTIHVAPPFFQNRVPYTVGIIKLGNLKIPGILKDVAPEKIKIGMALKLVFETGSSNQYWPHWPRYSFTLVP